MKHPIRNKQPAGSRFKTKKKLLNLLALVTLFISKDVFAYDWKASAQPALYQFSNSIQTTLQNLALKDWSPSPIDGQKKITQAIRAIKSNYLNLPRQELDPEDLYEAQQLLRYFNFRLMSFLKDGLQKNIITHQEFENLSFEMQTLSRFKNSAFKSPQKTLPFSGIKPSKWPIQRWKNESDFYNYDFIQTNSDATEVIYRGLHLRSGDVILNHPREKPVGLFSAISDEKSFFAHAGMIVFLKRNHKILPIVIDAHTLGVRAVPLHIYLSSRVISYGEIIRLKAVPKNFETQLEKQVLILLQQDIPYDFFGNRKNRALSCAELISYTYEQLGLQPIVTRNQSTPSAAIKMMSRIDKSIYTNIRKYGYFLDNILMPNDVALDPNFRMLGYVDNVIPFSENLINEALVHNFHNYTSNHQINLKIRPPNYYLSVFMTDQIRNPHSILGDLILLFTGYRRSNFPVGSKGILALVQHVDTVFGKAMGHCLDSRASKLVSAEKSCYNALQNQNLKIDEANYFSIHDFLQFSEIPRISLLELHEYTRLFHK